MADWDQYGEDYDHPPFEGRPRTYLIASTPRSGSHYLGHLLMASGQFGSPLEYFHQTQLKKWSGIFDGADVKSTFENLFRRRTSPSGLFGVKAHWGQFQRMRKKDDFIPWLNIEKIIWIRRKDKAAQAVSFAIAQQTKSWISLKTPQAEPKYSFKKVRALELKIRKSEKRWAAYFKRMSIQPVEVVYEDLIRDPGATLNQIYRAFGLPEIEKAPELSIDVQKQGSELNDRWRARYVRQRAKARAKEKAAAKATAA